eukprot:TRINITY_DN12092_c0_g1_i1.p2 TRINITY_DN12092_c0_g1~~TRINITY_DN12092_c0_g1_i1.p2  ORF type:complete len:101 (-),score=4.92 TRINITY_DN12092_c0_g1_i1:109-411(-)
MRSVAMISAGKRYVLIFAIVDLCIPLFSKMICMPDATGAKPILIKSNINMKARMFHFFTPKANALTMISGDFRRVSFMFCSVLKNWTQTVTKIAKIPIPN